ncbi:MAG: ribonuclease Z [Bryobacterales bacterium]|nr:ribonuclease Z [Bryobacterales bacterium]
MDALILGCGEAFDETLPNTSILVRAGLTVLLDCGYSAPPQVWKAEPDPDAIDLIYISHPHADHYFGLPALLGRMWEDGRTRPLTILSQPAVLEQLPGMMEYGYRGLANRFRYPIEYRAAAPGRAVEYEEVLFDFAESRHAVTNLAVRIQAGGMRLCYSGDGMFTDAGRRLFAGADLLIHEAYSFETSPVHADIGSILEMAPQEGIRRAALVHVQRGLRRQPERIHSAIEQAGVEAALPGPMTRITLGSAGAGG